MPLPSDLLQAVAAPDGGRLVIVMGAGCSYESPTDLPLARELSEQLHTQLVADGVLSEGDCPDPSDLSSLADIVYDKTGSQRDLVTRLESRWNMRTSKANSGYLNTAALMREGVLADVVTLNFDLALPNALAELDSSARVSTINGPRDFRLKSRCNVWFLHRNVNAESPDEWVLRTAALETEWKDSWEPIIAACTLAVPVVVFAGLGSPASVLIDSVSKIRDLLDPESVRLFLVDPNAPTSSFRNALDLPDDDCIELGWCDFMHALQSRVVEEQVRRIATAASEISRSLNRETLDLDPMHSQIGSVDLSRLGRLRATWLMSSKPYEPDQDGTRDFIADLLVGLAWIAQMWDAEVHLQDSGLVEVRVNDRLLGRYILVSGKGTMTFAAAEARIRHQRTRQSGLTPQTTGAFVSAMRESDIGHTGIAPPEHLVTGTVQASIVDGAGAFSIVPMHTASPSTSLANQGANE
jgi:hypothetical protein